MERSNEKVESTQDFNNEQLVMQIFESGTDEEMERLRQFFSERNGREVSREEMQRARAFAKQRLHLIEQSDQDSDVRFTTSPKADDLEYAVGIYRERLEPQVREAVFRLREKGYSSFESGFMGLESQRITFEAPVPELASYAFSEQVRRAFEGTGAEPFLKTNSVGFRMHELIPDEKLKELWDILAEDLPTLAEPQPLTTVRTAIDFRKKQDLRDARNK